jgi:wyosine [tRNA(Phe)-imidazoG37] synthetase (radical SAM superfamily)
MVQNPSQFNADNLKNSSCKTSRGTWKQNIWKKINEPETNKNKNIRELYRGINVFKKGYQTRINIMKDENGNLLTDL